jgi:hypothetical protein
MTDTCRQCGYARKEGDNECPKCGIIYNKFKLRNPGTAERVELPQSGPIPSRRDILFAQLTKRRKSWMKWQYEVLLAAGFVVIGFVLALYVSRDFKDLSLAWFLQLWAVFAVIPGGLVYWIRYKTYLRSEAWEDLERVKQERAKRKSRSS